MGCTQTVDWLKASITTTVGKKKNLICCYKVVKLETVNLHHSNSFCKLINLVKLFHMDTGKNRHKYS